MNLGLGEGCVGRVLKIERNEEYDPNMWHKVIKFSKN